MKVEEIKKLKSGKYKIKIDDKVITTYDDVILKNKLLYKKEINSDIYHQIGIDSIYYDAYHKALNYILRKVRSTLEVKKYLEDLEISNEDISKIINKLKENGMINDENYVRAYIADSFYLSNDGPNKISNYLLSQEIDEDYIESQIKKININEIENKLEKLILKKVKSDKRKSIYQLKQKILFDMINLGYSKDMILQVLNNINIEEDQKMEKEYFKLYNKLSKTLEGDELYKKIKEKLYSKGFDINEIKIYIDKKKTEI